MAKHGSFELLNSLRTKEYALYEKVCSLIKRTNTKKLRACGSGHSKLYDSPIFDSPNMLDMHQYIEEPYIENDNILVVSPGMQLGEIRDFLASYNLRLYGTPESETIAIGGAILCAAHNGSAHWHTMAYYVKEILLIDGTSELRCITNPDLFINYGLLGIVIRIKLQVFPAQNMHWSHALVDKIEHISVSPTTYCLYFGPYSGRILKTDISFTQKQKTRSIKRFFWDLALYPLQIRAFARLVPIITSIIPALGIVVSELFTYEPDAIRDKYDYFESVPDAPIFSLEYAIDRSNLQIVYHQVTQIIKKYQEKSTYVLRFWCRFQEKTELNNDLSYGRTTVLLEVTINNRQQYAHEFAQEIADIFLKFDGKPHLGKTVLRKQDVSNYDFSILKNAIYKFDPEQYFQNNYTKHLFGKENNKK